MIKLKDLLNEAKKPVKYYLDYTEDNLNRYVVADKDYNLYIAVVGIKKGERYVKFRISHPSYKSRFKQALKKFNIDVDLDKLYRG